MRRALPILLACVIGCTAEHDVRLGTPAAATIRFDRPEPLPELQRVRLEYLFAAIDRVVQSWPKPPADQELCLLLLAADAQWGVNCPEPPSPSFTRTSQTFRGQAVFARRGGQFDRNGRVVSTAELLHVMPAAAHVDAPGMRASELPARYPWLLLGSLEGLTTHHPAFESVSTEEWVSVAIHEVMHTRQLRMPGFAASLRAINSKAADPGRLIELYRSDVDYRRLVDAEYAHLVAAAWRMDATLAETRQVLADWLEGYDRRRDRLGVARTRDDGLFMYIEGVARYVESRFLVDQSSHPSTLPSGDPTFRNYARFAGRGYAGMPNKQLDSEYYYAIGFHLCVLLDRIDPSWKQRVHADPDWLVGTVRSAL